MSSFDSIFKSRAALRDLRDRLTALRTNIADVDARLAATTSQRDWAASSGNAADRALLDAKVAFLQSQKASLESQAASDDQQFAQLVAADTALRDAEPALWESVAQFPVALFPVRIETRFVEPEAAGGVDLLIRIYPDDLHIVAAGEPVREASANRSARAPAQVRLLPNHWNVFAIRSDALLFHVAGKPIPKDLPASLAPSTTPERRANDPLLGQWLVDFDAAVAVGMAMRIHLDDPNPTIDQLFVLGVDEQSTAAQASAAIAAALDGHAARARLGFLPVGAQTNNTSETPSAWSASTDGDVDVDADETRARTPTDNQNAALLARAFGLTMPPSFRKVPGAFDDGQTSVAAVTAATWLTLANKWLHELVSVRVFEAGASNTTMLSPPHDVVEMLRRHTVEYVRSRGPLPTLRIGRQPYGLLPASSLDLWTSDNDVDRRLIEPLRDLRLFCEAGLLNVPRKTGATDQDQAILDILARRPRSSGVVTRSTNGVKDPADALEPLVATPSVPWNASLNMIELSDDTEALPDDLPLVGDAEALARRFRDKAALIRERLTPEKVSTISSAIWATHVEGGAIPESERDLSDAAKASLRSVNNLLNVLVAKRPGIEFMAAFESSAGDGEMSREEGLARLAALSIQIQTEQAEILESLAAIPPEHYEPALLEVLDVFSYRLDAWITSLATRRLAATRSERRAGCHLGGYGWVENLTRDPQLPNAPARVGDFERVITDPSHTYVLAPSLHHATTAAVLRAGFEAHASPDAFAIRLTSRRAATARWILDGVRNGQPLGALLGYRFERGLHDRRLDDRIDDFRRLFPLPLVPEHDREADTGDAREAIAAQNVVDGLALHRGVGNVPAALKAGTEELFAELADAIDAVGDLLLAESVHQLVGGHPIRAGLAADTLGRGESIPDRFDVLRTPQSARAIACRVAIAIPVENRLPARGWSRERPRARLAPELEAWAAAILGDANQWRIRCEVTRGGSAQQKVCRLDELAISALDVVFESPGRDGRGSSVLERRIADHVADGQTDAQVRFASAEPGLDGWATLVALAARIRETLSTAAPLLPRDVDPLDPDSHTRIITSTLADRGTQFLKDFATARRSLQAAIDATDRAEGEAALNASAKAVAAALLDLSSFGVASAYPAWMIPASDADRSTLLTQARATLADVDARHVGSTLPQSPANEDEATVRGWLDASGRTLRSVLGNDFPIVPAFQAAPDGEWAKALAGSAPTGADPASAAAWIGRMGAVRPRLRGFHDALSAAEALGATPFRTLAVTQAPSGAAPEPWIALPFAGQQPPRAQRTVVIHAPAPLGRINAGTQLWGLVVDEWVEHLPGLDTLGGADRQSEIAGLSFRYDQPDARPPQAILLAVAPDLQRPWTLDTLLQVVRETLDLARLRAVELRDLPRLTPLLPAAYVSFDQRALDPVTVTWQQENPDGTISSGSFVSTPQRIDEWRSDLPL